MQWGESGVSVPGRILNTKGRGVTNELTRLSQLVTTPTGLVKDSEGAGMTKLARQAMMVDSNRQAGYGKRVQLIPDGLSDPLSHLAQAMKLAHPFSAQNTLKQDHREVLSFSKQFPESLYRARLARL